MHSRVVVLSWVFTCAWGFLLHTWGSLWALRVTGYSASHCLIDLAKLVRCWCVWWHAGQRLSRFEVLCRRGWRPLECLGMDMCKSAVAPLRRVGQGCARSRKTRRCGRISVGDGAPPRSRAERDGHRQTTSALPPQEKMKEVDARGVCFGACPHGYRRQGLSGAREGSAVSARCSWRSGFAAFQFSWQFCPSVSSAHARVQDCRYKLHSQRKVLCGQHASAPSGLHILQRKRIRHMVR